MDKKLKQFIYSLKLSSDIKIFGIKLGKAGHEFGAVNVKANPNWAKDDEIPSSKAVKTLITSDISTAISAEPTTIISDSFQLIPQNAYISITYGVDQEFIITANINTIEGEDITIEFIDPEDVSQALALSYDSELKVVTISHATDETGTISTSTNALVTAINTDVTVSEIITAEAGSDGGITEIGTINLDDYIPGVVAKAGDILCDGISLYIVLNNVDGTNNESTDFKKVTLSNI